ncbi:DUF1992 domain-containing protein [Tropicimonas isoalkanivorans]|uniref:DnaJ homologue subfamily C member 28 conserved domain-containing protein n=1 Tax=Tropicimonas isoalkanivorans TaxID=441112 RepID=A0A1I1GKI7_9RHOB|nr:DUF1992 domain-containing protein [Tropicimonas isoalkanivorans]SFC11782.1 protein of unknown function [Tropicimonas isoalkanivorans]
MQRWDRIAESRLRKAEADGSLSNLSGAGKPLPDRPDAGLVDTGTAVGHRIMAEAGALPREISLKKELQALREQYAAESDPVAKKALMARMAEVQMRLGMEQDARRAFFRT